MPDTCAVEQLLPIPAQEGATIRLPATFALRPGTIVDGTGGHIELSRGSRRVRFRSNADLNPALRRFLDGVPLVNLYRYGDGFAALCRKLLLMGLASEPGPGHVKWAPSHGELGGPNLVALISDLRDNVRPANDPGFALQQSIIAGECTPPVLAGWFLENYHYVRSAPHHCAPVLEHDMPNVQRNLWRRFLFEESWHWRIFRPLFSVFDWPWTENRVDTPGVGTLALTGVLESAARTSPIAYAATLLLTEQVPKTANVHNDPLYVGAIRLGVPERALRSLWWHAWSQCPSAHSTLGAMIISQQETVSQLDASAALGAFERTYRAAADWGNSVTEENRTARLFSLRTGLEVPRVLIG